MKRTFQSFLRSVDVITAVASKSILAIALRAVIIVHVEVESTLVSKRLRAVWTEDTLLRVENYLSETDVEHNDISERKIDGREDEQRQKSRWIRWKTKYKIERRTNKVTAR